MLEETFDEFWIIGPLLAVVSTRFQEHCNVLAVHLCYGQLIPRAKWFLWHLDKSLNLLELLKIVGEFQNFFISPNEIEKVKSLQVLMESLQLRGYLLLQEVHILYFWQQFLPNM